MAQEPPKIALVIYDFDQTISKRHLYHELEGGLLDRLAQVDDAELTAIFGGENRIKRLHVHFDRVSKEAEMVIISYGYVDVIRKALERMELGNFWNETSIIGSDSDLLRNVSYKKASVIKKIRAKKKIKSNQVLFVDDDPKNITQAKNAAVCETILIEPREGMAENHMAEIEKAVGYVPPKDPPNNEEKHPDDEEKNADNDNDNDDNENKNSKGGRNSGILVTSPKGTKRAYFPEDGKDGEAPNENENEKDNKENKINRFAIDVHKLQKFNKIMDDGDGDKSPVLHVEYDEHSMSESDQGFQLAFPESI